MMILFTGGPADGRIEDRDVDDAAEPITFAVDGEDLSTGHYDLVGQLPPGSAAEWRAQWFEADS